MKKTIKFVLAVLALVVVSFVVMTGLANGSVAAPPPSSYALGHAKACKPEYVKRTLTKWVEGFALLSRQAAKVQIRYIGCLYAPNVYAAIGAPKDVTFTPATTTTTTIPVATSTAPATVAATTPTTTPTTTTTTTVPSGPPDVTVVENTVWNQTVGSSPFVNGQPESFTGTVSATVSLSSDGATVSPPAGTLAFTVFAQYLGDITLTTESAGQTSCDISLTGEDIETIDGITEGSWHWTSDNCSGGDPLLDNTQDMESVAVLSVTATFSDVSYSVVKV